MAVVTAELEIIFFVIDLPPKIQLKKQKMPKVNKQITRFDQVISSPSLKKSTIINRSDTKPSSRRFTIHVRGEVVSDEQVYIIKLENGIEYIVVNSFMCAKGVIGRKIEEVKIRDCFDEAEIIKIDNNRFDTNFMRQIGLFKPRKRTGLGVLKSAFMKRFSESPLTKQFLGKATKYIPHSIVSALEQDFKTQEDEPESEDLEFDQEPEKEDVGLGFLLTNAKHDTNFLDNIFYRAEIDNADVYPLADIEFERIEKSINDGVAELKSGKCSEMTTEQFLQQTDLINRWVDIIHKHQQSLINHDMF